MNALNDPIRISAPTYAYGDIVFSRAVILIMLRSVFSKPSRITISRRNR